MFASSSSESVQFAILSKIFLIYLNIIRAKFDFAKCTSLHHLCAVVIDITIHIIRYTVLSYNSFLHQNIAISLVFKPALCIVVAGLRVRPIRRSIYSLFSRNTRITIFRARGLFLSSSLSDELRLRLALASFAYTR